MKSKMFKDVEGQKDVFYTVHIIKFKII